MFDPLKKNRKFILLALALAAVFFLPSVTQAAEGWYAEYYTNNSLNGSPALTRSDGNIDFNWGNGSPAPQIPADNFSVRWSQTLHFEEGDYEFSVRADDGVRLFVDGALIIDDWNVGAAETHRHTRFLGTGNHTVRLEYFESGGDASVRLWWERKTPSRLIGNIVTWADPGTWVRIYRRMPDGAWQYMNPGGTGPIDPSGRIKIDGLPVEPYYGDRGQPYRVELWTQGAMLRSVGDTDAGQPEFRVYPHRDNITPWGPPPVAPTPQPTAPPYTAPSKPQPEHVVVVPPGTDAVVVSPGTEVIVIDDVKKDDHPQPQYGVGGLATGTIVNAHHLNVRRGPGVGHRVVGTVSKGEVVEVTGYRNPSATWIQIRTGGVIGWINAYYIRTPVAIRNLTVVH